MAAARSAEVARERGGVGFSGGRSGSAGAGPAMAAGGLVSARDRPADGRRPVMAPVGAVSRPLVGVPSRASVGRPVEIGGAVCRGEAGRRHRLQRREGGFDERRAAASWACSRVCSRCGSEPARAEKRRRVSMYCGTPPHR